MFNFLKDKFSKIYTSFTSKVASLFSKNKIDQETLAELEKLLISADMGVKVTRKIINKLDQDFQKGLIQKGADLKEVLETNLLELLAGQKDYNDSSIYLLVGINGSGKTTFAGKLANMYAKQGKKVLLVAGDTFRAAATNQLLEWSQKSNVAIEIGKDQQEPASVIFTACERFKKENFDILIIDTAGRLQTKVNLMKELEKIKRIITKQLPEFKINTLLVIDSMLGQNSFEQAKIFNESTQLDGVVLSKMDGTGKAGVAFAIVQELNIPISYVAFGESIDQMNRFDSKPFVQQLLSE